MKDEKINKLATDLVELSLQWKKVKKESSFKYEILNEVHLLDLMTDEILKTFTNIEELSEKADKKDKA